MDMNVGQTGTGDSAVPSGKNGGVVSGMTAAAMTATGIGPAGYRLPDRSMPLLVVRAPAPVHAARTFDEPGHWPMQAMATDMVEFAEMLHRRLQSLHRGSSRPALAIGPVQDTFKELEHSLIALLARNGIERRDPIGSAFDQSSQQKTAELHTSSCTPGTVVQTLSSTWMLNDQLLRPASVVVATS